MSNVFSVLAPRHALCLLLLSSLIFTQAVQAAPAKIKSAVLSTGFKGDAVHVTQIFRPTDRTIHATLKLDRVSTGDKIKAIWFVLNAGGLRNYRLTEKTQITRKMNLIHFLTAMKRTWPRGTYRVDFYVNGQRQRMVTFVVR